jgi:hypothetical protein
MQHPDVLSVHVNPLAASVAIECRDGFELLGQNHRFPGLEVLAVEPYSPANKQPAPFAPGHDGSKLNPADTIGFVELVITWRSRRNNSARSSSNGLSLRSFKPRGTRRPG